MTSIFVDIVTQLKGAENLKKTEQGLDRLTSAAKKLVSGFVFEKVVQNSLEAFKAETSAITTLTNSLANLGISYSSIEPVITKTTDSMTNLGFTTSDSLSALAKLTTALGNPTKALAILGTTADLARYNHASLADTATKVAKVVAGNGKAVTELGLKYDKSLTPVNAFNKLIDQTKAKVGGLAVAYSKTAAGALDVLNAKTDQASAKLGEKMAPAVQKLAEFALKFVAPIGNLIADNLAPLAAFALGVWGIVTAMTALNSEFTVLNALMDMNPIFLGLTAAAAAVSIIVKGLTQDNKINPSKATMAGKGGGGMTYAGKDNSEAAAARIKKKAEEDKKKLSKAEQILADAQKKADAEAKKASDALAQSIALQNKQRTDQIKLEKAQLALKQASKTLDLQQIEIAAALQNKNISEKDKTSLLLQQAILNENADTATALAKQLKDMKDELAKIIPDPFTAFTAGANAAADAVTRLKNLLPINPFTSTNPDRTPPGMGPTNPTTGAPVPPELRPGVSTGSTGTGSVPMNTGTGSIGGTVAVVAPAPVVQVTVNLDGQAVAGAVTDSVTNQQIQNTAAGVAGAYNRSQTFIY